MMNQTSTDSQVFQNVLQSNSNESDYFVHLLGEAIEKAFERKSIQIENIVESIERLSSSVNEKEAISNKKLVDQDMTMKDDTKNLLTRKEVNDNEIKDSSDTIDEESKQKNHELSIEPVKKKVQRPVYVAYKINCVSDINESSCTFEIDMKVFFSWWDEKLIGRKKGCDVNTKEEKDLFEPDIIVTNEHNLITVSNSTKLVDSLTGEVKRTVTYKGTLFLLSMNLRAFPFDCQNLQVCLKPYKLSKDSIILIPKSFDECAFAHPVVHEWDVLGHCMKTFDTDPKASSSGKAYSTLFITVLVRHHPGWFIANVFLPTFTFLLISWITFLYGYNMPERNDVIISTFMASIANKYVVSGQIPKVGYRTLLDRYLDFCFYMQFLAAIATAIVCEGHALPIIGPYLNISFFMVELILTVLFHEWLFVRLGNHRMDINEWLAEAKRANELQADNDHSSNDRDYSTSSIFGNPLATSASLRRLKKQKSILSFILRWMKLTYQDFDDGGDSSAPHELVSFGASSLRSFVANRKKTDHEQSLAIMEDWKSFSALAVLRLAYATNDEVVIRNAAARMLQARWRAKCARKALAILKIQRENELRDNHARVIQRAYRARIKKRLTSLTLQILRAIVNS